MPGRTYRNDSDQTHTPMFHQVEGLVIDKDSAHRPVALGAGEFLKAFFEVPSVTLRFRPSFFLELPMESTQCDRSGSEVKIGEGSRLARNLAAACASQRAAQCGPDPDVYFVKLPAWVTARHAEMVCPICAPSSTPTSAGSATLWVPPARPADAVRWTFEPG